MSPNKKSAPVDAETVLGPLLARCRAEKKLKLSDVAKKVGLGVATLSRFERGVNTKRTNRTTTFAIEGFLRGLGYLPKRGKAA